MASQSAIQQSITPAAGTMRIQCVPMSASGISVIPQPAAASAAPAQQIRVVQAASTQPQVVHQPQQYQVIQQQQVNVGATQGNAGLTLMQTASGQLVLQQAQAMESTDSATGSHAQVVVNNSNQPRVNYGNIHGVQLGGGIQLQSAVAAQPIIVQQQTVAPSAARSIVVQQTVAPSAARNIVVQTVPVVSVASSSAAAANVIQLGGGSTHVSSINRTSQPMSNQSTEQDGVLVQIGGQTYRMHGVQQVQVANATRPTQLVQSRRHIAPAAPSHLSTHASHLSTHASQLSTHASHLSTHPSQLSTVSKQSTAVTSSVTAPCQTITLTSSQLALLKQTPPEKQLGMIQLFQRQMAQRSGTKSAVLSGSNSAVVSPMKSVQLVNSVVSSSPLQRSALSTQTARLAAPTIVRAGPPVAVRVGQNPSSATAGNTQSLGLHVLRPKPAGEMNTVHSAVIGQCCLV